MTSSLWWMAQTTATALLLAGVVLLACRFLKTRPAVQHLLWLVILIKLLTPPVVAWPWAPFGASWLPSREVTAFVDDDPPSRVSSTSVADGEPAADGYRDAVIPLEAESFAPVVGMGAPSDLPTITESVPLDLLPTHSPPDSLPFPSENSLLDRHWHWHWSYLWSLLTAVWMIGASVTLLVQARRVWKFQRLLYGARLAPVGLVREVERLAATLGLRRAPLTLTARVSSPCIWCWGRPRLIWPEGLAGEPQRAKCRGIIAHELAHVRRRDHWAAWLEMSAAVIWWWNPLLWYVRRRLRETADLACDAEALHVIPNERRQYAEVFFELSQAPVTAAPATVLGATSGGRRTFERRLAMILSQHATGEVSLRSLLASGVLALAGIPAWSLAQEAAKPAAAEPAATAAESAAQPAAEAKPDSIRQKTDARRREIMKEVEALVEAGRFDEAQMLLARLKQLGAATKSVDAEARGEIMQKVKALVEAGRLEEAQIILEQLRNVARSPQSPANSKNPLMSPPTSTRSALADGPDPNRASARQEPPADATVGREDPFGGTRGSTAARVAGLEQIDLVSLATAYTDAIGSLKLARSRHDRLKGAAGTITEDAIDAAAINLETAQRKVELLTEIAQGALDAAKIEAAHAERMYKKGYMSDSQAAAARMKFRILESILKNR